MTSAYTQSQVAPGTKGEMIAKQPCKGGKFFGHADIEEGLKIEMHVGEELNRKGFDIGQGGIFFGAAYDGDAKQQVVMEAFADPTHGKDCQHAFVMAATPGTDGSPLKACSATHFDKETCTLQFLAVLPRGKTYNYGDMYVTLLLVHTQHQNLRNSSRASKIFQQCLHMYTHFACDHNPYKHTNIRYILNTSFPPRLQQNAHSTEGLDAIRKIVPIMYNGEPVPFLRSTTQFLTFRPINLAAPFMPGLVIMSSCGKLNSKRATIKATTLALHQQLQDTTLVSIENSLESRILRLQSEDEKGVPSTDLVDICTYDVVTDGVMTTKNFLKNDMCVSLAKPVIMFWLSMTSEEELDEATTDKTCNAAKTFFAVNNFPMSTSPGDTIDQEIFGNPLHTASLLEPNLLQGLAKSLLNSAPFHSSLTTYVKFAEHIPDINDEGAWNNEDEAAKSHIIEHVLNTLRIGTSYLIAHVINSGQTLMAIQTVHPESANYVEFLCKFTTMARSLAHDG